MGSIKVTSGYREEMDWLSASLFLSQESFEVTGFVKLK